MINNVVLIGRLTRDPELRYTPSNVAVATFNLAVNRNFKGANGEREADFINCIMWRIYVTEVVAESFQTLEKKDTTANRSSMENQMPPSFGASDPMDIPDDGLPF